MAALPKPSSSTAGYFAVYRRVLYQPETAFISGDLCKIQQVFCFNVILDLLVSL